MTIGVNSAPVLSTSGRDIAEEEDFDTAIAEKNEEEKAFERPTSKNVPSSILARVKTLPSEEELGAGE